MKVLPRQSCISVVLTSRSLQLALLQDHISTLYPTRPTPFTSFHDVVEKLVPYHIWQIHDEELAGSGKEQQSVLDAREEKGEFRDALSCWSPLAGLPDYEHWSSLSMENDKYGTSADIQRLAQPKISFAA